MDAMSGATPHLPWKTRLLIAVLSVATDCCRRSNGTVNRSLMKFLDVKAPASTKPINGVISSDITVDPSRNLWFRLYTPTSSSSNNSKLPVIVYFHGGGFIYFGPNSKPFDDLCHRLAGEVSAVVISVSYRLAPEYRYPCQYDDGFDALKFIDDGDKLFLPLINADLSRCFLAGDSAGGNIAHHVTLRAAEHSFNKVKIKGVIAIQPYFGGEKRTESELRLRQVPFVNLERTDWSWKAFLPEGSDRDHEAVNVFGSEAENNNNNNGRRRWRWRWRWRWRGKYPATLVIVGGWDPLQDWQRRYCEGLKREEYCGKEYEVDLVEYPNAIHGFYIFPELPEASQLITRLRAFIQKQSAG